MKEEITDLLNQELSEEKLPLDYEDFQDIINRYKYSDILSTLNSRLAQWCDSTDIMNSYSLLLERLEDTFEDKSKENYTISY